MGDARLLPVCSPSPIVSFDPVMLFGQFLDEEASRQGRVEGMDAKYGGFGLNGQGESVKLLKIYEENK